MMTTGLSYGYIIGAIFKKEETALAASTILLTPLVLFGGQFSSVDSMPKAFS